jgi:hypothetical protein
MLDPVRADTIDRDGPREAPVISDVQKALVVLSAPPAGPLVGAPVISEAKAVSPPKAEVSLRADPGRYPDQTACVTEAITGSRFIKRVCETGVERNERQRRLFAFEREQHLDPSGAQLTPLDGDGR